MTPRQHPALRAAPTQVDPADMPALTNDLITAGQEHLVCGDFRL